MLRLTHILFAGLGGHGAVVFPMIRASGQDAKHRLIFVGKEELLPSYADECERLDVPYRFLRTTGGVDLAFHAALTAELCRHPADAVLVHSTGSLPAALLVRARPWRPRTQVVVVEHQAWHLRDQRHRWATRLGLLLADKTIVLQDPAKTYLEQTHPRLTRRADVRVIPNGVEIDRYSPGKQQRASEPRDSGPVRIGMQSRLVPIKDHQTLIRAIPLLEAALGEQVILDLAGDGSSRQSLRRLAESLGVAERVCFRGTLLEHELIEFLRDLDIYVHASLGEGLSTALLQAMAVGLPIVASNVPGITELMADRDVGVLVAPEDPEAIAAAIAALVRVPSRRHSLGQASRAMMEADYSSQRMWQAYRRALEPTF